MNTLPYQQAFERIHAEFQEMPGMRLTPQQVERLSGVEGPVCQRVLDDLVRAGFLCTSTNGSYARRPEASTSGSRIDQAAWNEGRPLPAARRAS